MLFVIQYHKSSLTANRGIDIIDKAKDFRGEMNTIEKTLKRGKFLIKIIIISANF